MCCDCDDNFRWASSIWLLFLWQKEHLQLSLSFCVCVWVSACMRVWEREREIILWLWLQRDILVMVSLNEKFHARRDNRMYHTRIMLNIWYPAPLYTKTGFLDQECTKMVQIFFEFAERYETGRFWEDSETRCPKPDFEVWKLAKLGFGFWNRVLEPFWNLQVSYFVDFGGPKTRKSQKVW